MPSTSACGSLELFQHLDIEPTDDLKKVQRAFRKKTLQIHPDKSTLKNALQEIATEQTKQLSQLYEAFKKEHHKKELQEVIQKINTEDNQRVWNPEKYPILTEDDFANLDVHQLLKITDELSVEHCKALCKVLPDKAPFIFTSVNDVVSLFPITEQRMFVFAAWKHELLPLIETPASFMDLLQLLTADQRTTLLEACQHKLPSLIETPSDLLSIFQVITEDQCKFVCTLSKDGFYSIFKTASDFTQFLSTGFTPEEITFLLETYKDELQTIPSIDPLEKVTNKNAFKESFENFKEKIEQVDNSIDIS